MQNTAAPHSETREKAGRPLTGTSALTQILADSKGESTAMRAKSLRDTRVSSSHLTGYHHSLRMIASLSTCSCNTTTPAPAPAPVRHAFTRRSLRPVNPLKELHDLAGLFPEPADAPLFLNARHVAREATPEPYRTMLVHEHHMTISMESALASWGLAPPVSLVNAAAI